MTLAPSQLERGWRLAESRGPSGADTVAADPLDIEVNGGRLMLGADTAGVRHLLIPISSGTTVSTESSGPAIGLRKRVLVLEGLQRTFVDLACFRPDLFDQFAVLCSDVVQAVTSMPADVAKAAEQVLLAWRELLRAISAPRLDRNSVIGLYAELTVLERLQRLDPRLGVEAWTGPSRGRYDFQRGSVVLEVKGSTARRGRPIVVHGLDQLEAPPNAALHLWWFRLEVGVGRGESLREIVDRLLQESLSPGDVQQKLRNVGYNFENAELYDQPLLTELESRLYLVDSTFPTFTRADLVGGELPRGIRAVSYEMDLSGDEPRPVSPAEEERLLQSLAGRL